MMIRALLPLLSLFACSDFDLGNFGATPDSSPEGSDDEDLGDTGTDGADANGAPEWMAIDGTLHVVDGVPDVAQSALWIEYRDATNAAYEPGMWDEVDGPQQVPCETALRALSFTVLAPPEEAVTMAWWSITVDEVNDPDCPWRVPRNLYLGLGEVDPALGPALDLAGMDSADTLYGLYVRYGNPATPVWTFGVAGTSSQYEGTTTPPQEPPLPDGTYVLTALHLLPYDGD